MNKIKIICVGKIKEAYFKNAINYYINAMKKNICIEIIELDDIKLGDNMSAAEEKKVKDLEGQKISSKLNDNDYVISLEIEGKQFTSSQLQNKMLNLMEENQRGIAFIIGGSLGISDIVKKRSNQAISFSKMTFPHQFMRVILLEQLYRVLK